MMPFFRLRREQKPPPMTLEGVLGPNGRLDEAAGMQAEAPEALCVAHGRLLFTSGKRVMSLDAWGGQPQIWAAFDAPVTALCPGPGGMVAVGLSGGRVAVVDAAGQPDSRWSLPTGLAASVVDCVFQSNDELLLVDCGYDPDDDLLARAAWDEEARGQVIALGRSGETRVVAADLHCPMGVCLDAQGNALVSLLERASILDLPSGSVRQTGYPGYLGRLRRTGNGFALACLSRRDPLIEFIKTEPAFVAEMKAKIEPRHWIAPRANPEFSHDLPIELGATRLFGEVKPWAPSFSYGLLIQLDDELMPVGSAQSRADGRRHAICDMAVWDGDLIAVSRSSGEILNLGKEA